MLRNLDFDPGESGVEGRTLPGEIQERRRRIFGLYQKTYFGSRSLTIYSHLYYPFFLCIGRRTYWSVSSQNIFIYFLFFYLEQRRGYKYKFPFLRQIVFLVYLIVVRHLVESDCLGHLLIHPFFLLVILFA